MKVIRHIPNALSLFRLFSPVLLYYFIHNGLNWHFVLCFLTAAISDFLDGYIARKFSITSRSGAILDPLADKSLIAFSFIIFYSVGSMHFLTLFVVLARDLGILLFVGYMRIKKVKLKFAPLYSSKINTTIQLIFIGTLTLSLVVNNHAEYSFFKEIIVIISTVISGVDYFRKKEQFIQNA